MKHYKMIIKLASYTTKKSIQDRIQYDNEFMLILENFILQHPDFSFNNSRGIMFFSSRSGILGYNTSSKNASCKQESRKAKEVILQLEKSGWKFGCNNYSNNNISDVEFVKDLSLLNKDIKSIIGNTPLYSFCNNPHLVNNTTKQELLIANGFRIFFTEDNSSPNFTIENNHVIISKREINGNTLRHNSEQLSHLFNCYNVYDHSTRHIKFPQPNLTT